MSIEIRKPELKRRVMEGIRSGRLGALDWSQCPPLKACPKKMSGAWVFRNTRMPVAAVFENIEDGVTIDELLDLFDGLTRDQVRAVLDFAARSLH